MEKIISDADLPKEFGENWAEFMQQPIGIFNSDGNIKLTDYRLENIHEFVKAFCLPNMDEKL